MAVTASRLPPEEDYFQALRDLANIWNLRDRESRALVAVPERTYYRWKKANHGHLSPDQKDRVSHLATIALALERIFQANSADAAGVAREWVRKPNRAFDGRTPLDVMLHDGFVGILRVRTYLEGLQ